MLILASLALCCSYLWVQMHTAAFFLLLSVLTFKMLLNAIDTIIKQTMFFVLDDHDVSNISY